MSACAQGWRLSSCCASLARGERSCQAGVPASPSPGCSLALGGRLLPHHPGSRLPGTALGVQALAPRGSRLWGLELGAEPVGLRKERAVWCTLSAWRRCGAGRQKSEHWRDPPRPEDAARRMASWRGLFGLTFMCLLMRGRGEGGSAGGQLGAWMCASLWSLSSAASQRTSAGERAGPSRLGEKKRQG